jgi:uncharacterized CHY-type Zn-finger protein
VFHNIEANEYSSNIFCPFIDKRYNEFISSFTKVFFSKLDVTGYHTIHISANTPKGAISRRLYGWCADKYYACDIPYEINSRNPAHPLSIREMEEMGRILSESSVTWLSSKEGLDLNKYIIQMIELKKAERIVYKERNNGEISKRDSILYGF